MGNTNFQTIHQMGTAISDFVKQATGRGNVQNVVMDHVTVAQNHRYEEVDISGRAVSFQAGEAGLPFEKMVVHIEPVQSGSGDPSPDNIRPITGWTMVNVYQAGQNMEDARVYRFTFPSEAGIVYGGELTVNDDGTGTLVVDRTAVDPNNWVQYNASNGYKAYRIDHVPFGRYSGQDQNVPMSNIISKFGSFNSSNMDRNIIQVPTNNMSAAYLALRGDIDPTTVQLSYLCNPVEYPLTDIEVLETLKGVNNIWADTGDIEVKFTNVKELY